MAKNVDSIKHSNATRPHIPSKEEAGYEDANPSVQDGKKVLELSKNPVTHRGQDPELYWLNKYGNDDRDELLRVDIRSLYRHEHIAPETLISNLYSAVSSQPSPQLDMFASANELFGNALEKDEIDKVSEYYQHQDGWTNRLIQGDSHLVMASLLEREGMAGQVQTIYFDPPYGIKYGGNWQNKLNNRDVKDGNDEAITSEPEQIKAFRDTWELGIHSYLSYLRDRLLIAKELLTESGSCFVQIGDENVHLVRCLMDEVFGSENFISSITFYKTAGQTANNLASTTDYIIWYSKNKENLKYRQLYLDKSVETDASNVYTWLEFPDGTRRRMTSQEKISPDSILKNTKVFRISSMTSQSGGETTNFPVELGGKIFTSGRGFWKTNRKGIENLIKKRRVVPSGISLGYVRYIDDFPVYPIANLWNDTGTGSFTDEKKYVVQTGVKVIQRCILMTTDPGDLVLDPTCGSGTTAYVAEQWGRRWITIDTSRIALNIAKQRLMTAVFPYYNLYDEENGDIRQGFKYKTVPHITLKSLANDEPAATETLYDKPEEDKKLLRVSGPFTVETLQNYEPVDPSVLDDEIRVNEEEGAFEEVIKQHLVSAGIKNGRKNEMVIFRSVELLAGEAIKACRQKGDAQWLVILGFSFESDIEGGQQTMSMGTFQVDKVRIHDDLLQEGLKKKPAKSAASFVTIGEPDIEVVSNQWLVDSSNNKIINYEQFKKLSGLNSLEEINGLGREHLPSNKIFPEGGTIRTNESNATGGSEHTIEHRRRAIEELQRRVSAISGHSAGVTFGTGNAVAHQSTSGLSDRNAEHTHSDGMSGSRQNAEWSEILTQVNALTATHLPLTTGNWALITIKGLDIYDPIRGIVKARDIADIAYWIVDDDYDGSNFVVKQVFFCGGEKDEFSKWKKGLDNLAKDNTKKKVEKTLKIEIDEEAFDRLYGHISHPIEIKNKGQKIAVRIISQFGEECMKVLSL